MQLTAQTLLLGLAWYVVFLFSTTLHEAAHAWVAHRLGDPTAYHGGQVTLNPLPHVRREVFGTVIMPILSFALSGWMMGWASAPYDPHWAARHPRRAAWMSLAGPAANLLLVLVAGTAVRLGVRFGIFAPPPSITFSQLVATAPGFGGLGTVVSILFTLNLVLFAFNLIPLPPLDGSGALGLVLGPTATLRYQALIREPLISIIGLLAAWRLFGYVFSPLHTLALDLLYPGLLYR